MDTIIDEQIDIYTREGWLNIPHIVDKCPAWLYVFIGKRQVGKTYNTLKYLIDNNIEHILLRRTVDEVELITSDASVCPYSDFEPEYKIGLFPAKKLSVIADYHTEDNKQVQDGRRGICVGLPTIAKMRGFKGSIYHDVVFDEFIPEKHVIMRKTEGDALLNAYTTINGNRELNGSEPLRLWLLANANSISSPIMEAFGLSDIVIDLMQSEQEYFYNGSIFVCLPTSKQVTDARSETALMKHLKSTGSGGRFIDMALNNEFSYDDLSKVKKLDIKGYRPLFNFNNFMYGWYDPKGHRVYICRSRNKLKPYSDSEQGIYNFCATYDTLFDLYRLNEIYFSDARVLTKFCDIYKINNS